MKKLLTLALGMLSAGLALAQDPQLSQFYAAPLYLNPAFTGTLDVECRKFPASRFRFIGNHRNQYQGSLVTNMFSVDYGSKSGYWGLGLLAYQDQIALQQAQASTLSTYSFTGLVAYKVALNPMWKLHSGVSLGYTNRSTDLGGYIFPDQLNSTGIYRDSREPMVQLGPGVSAGYISAGAGVLVFTDAFYAGISGSHINQPNQSLLGSTDKLPIKLDFHSGYRISFTRETGMRRKLQERSITPTVHVKQQGSNTRAFDLGSYFTYDPVTLGLWYRGVPIEQAPEGSVQQDALVVLLGFRAPTDYGLFKLGLSYDVPITRGSQQGGRTFEISLAYQIMNDKCRRQAMYRSIPCPGI